MFGFGNRTYGGGLGGSNPGLGSIRKGLGMSSMNDPLNSGVGSLSFGGGMNPMSDLQAHSNFATQFQRNPMGSPMSGPSGFGGY